VFEYVVRERNDICILDYSNVYLNMAQMPSLQNVQSEGKDVQLFRVRMRGIFEKVTAGIR
jgi:hypothetical protein